MRNAFECRFVTIRISSYSGTYKENRNFLSAQKDQKQELAGQTMLAVEVGPALDVAVTPPAQAEGRKVI